MFGRGYITAPNTFIQTYLQDHNLCAYQISQIMAPTSLPDEILLEIFRETDPRTLWLSIRNVNQQFRACAEDIVRSELIRRFTVGLNYTLGSGSHHRWYDIRGSITLSFKQMSRLNPQYALFEKLSIRPEACNGRAWEKWNRMCAGGFGAEQEWRVQLDDRDPRVVRMPKLVISHKHGLWCDWREMLNAYFSQV